MLCRVQQGEVLTEEHSQMFCALYEAVQHFICHLLDLILLHLMHQPVQYLLLHKQVPCTTETRKAYSINKNAIKKISDRKMLTVKNIFVINDHYDILIFDVSVLVLPIMRQGIEREGRLNYSRTLCRCLVSATTLQGRYQLLIKIKRLKLFNTDAFLQDTKKICKSVITLCIHLHFGHDESYICCLT